MSPRVPFLDLGAVRAALKPELDEALARAMDSGWYVLGREVDGFEQEWAAYCGTAHAVGVANGLQALELVLRAWGVGPDDEVVVPANTYIASWLAVTACGAAVVPVEPDPVTSTLDPARVEAALTPRTKAIMLVHLYGRCAETSAVLDLARDRDVRVLEDAAQAHGARLGGRRAGGLADAAGWSFYPTKNLGAFGDAGAVTTDDAELADRLRVLRNYGSRRKYEHEVEGTNSRLDELQAALLRVGLRHLDERNARRAAHAEAYLEQLGGLPGLRLPPPPRDGHEPVWHVFAVHHARRDALQAALAEDGIGTLIFYPVPPHLSGAYAELGLGEGAFPITEELARTTLAIPVGPDLTAEQRELVVAALRRALSG